MNEDEKDLDKIIDRIKRLEWEVSLLRILMFVWCIVKFIDFYILNH